MSDVFVIETAVDAEYARQAGAWPNLPNVDDYERHAEALGFQVQRIVDSANSTGCYYKVSAIYEAGADRFGSQPAALVFEDYSRSVDVTWMFVPHGSDA